MITESKVIELFCIADDFCKFFDAMMARYTLKPANKRAYHRDSTMSKAEIMLTMILDNFIVNLLSAIAEYCCFPKETLYQCIEND